MRSNLHITFGGEGNTRHTHTFICAAGRHQDLWVVTCDAHPHIVTRARLLASAIEQHRSSLAVAADVLESAVTVVVYPMLPRRVHEMIEQWWTLRDAATGAYHDAAVAHQAIARALADWHLTLRDIGTILGVSHQRAHQLIINHAGGGR